MIVEEFLYFYMAKIKIAALFVTLTDSTTLWEPCESCELYLHQVCATLMFRSHHELQFHPRRPSIWLCLCSKFLQGAPLDGCVCVRAGENALLDTKYGLAKSWHLSHILDAIFSRVKIYLFPLKHEKWKSRLWYADYYFDVGLSDVSGVELQVRNWHKGDA